ncbi:DUF6573 family protein [Microbacterium sp.]|uniref:DUF6573 family protein n=1 Tax=Microbacterium sp. TaxID=51671 RepID=UPI003F990E16
MNEFGNVIFAYTAADAVADGLSTRPYPEVATEAGYNLPVILTRAAHTAVIEWTREDYPQDETGRFWDVLTTARRAAQRAAANPGDAFGFNVLRVANTTVNGKHSRAELPQLVALTVRVEVYDRELTPCLVIALPGED